MELLPLSRQFDDNLPMEADEFVKGLLEDPFLIAVSAETQRSVLDVSYLPNSVTLDAACSHLGHIGSTRQHSG